MLENFKTYQLAKNFYQECKTLNLPLYLRDQLLRAASSTALNLAEGSAKPTKKDQVRFYAIAHGSHCEVQAILDLEGIVHLKQASQILGACLHKLVYR